MDGDGLAEGKCRSVTRHGMEACVEVRRRGSADRGSDIACRKTPARFMDVSHVTVYFRRGSPVVRFVRFPLVGWRTGLESRREGKF